MKKIDEYDISLDIGTGSVGYAVTSGTDLLKFKGKNMWGVSIFRSGETAEKTRLHRSTRRRYDRRRNRINLLQELFNEDILAIDDGFFIRMKESFLHKEHKSLGSLNGLFADKDFDDKKYFKNYPTIYHLRHALVNSERKFDIRLVYLAIHNIVKYRGNFLYERQNFDISSGIVESFEVVANYLCLNEISYTDFERIILDWELYKKEKVKRLQNLLAGGTKDQRVNQLIKIIMGDKANVVKIFDIEHVDGKLNLSFSNEGDENYNEAVELIQNKSDEDGLLFEALKKIYSFYIIRKLMKNDSNTNSDECSISKAMINKFNIHAEDLKNLKVIYRKHFSDYHYNKMFRHYNGDKYKNVKNYNVYINNISKCSKDELYKAIKKDISDINDTLVDDVITKIDNEEFLQKLNTVDNAQIPYQLNLSELESIIDKQSKYYPNLLENRDKIISLFKFRIPYYVGPLNANRDNNKVFSWMERKAQDKIYPWNFEEVVDLEKSATNFILKMTNQCTYFPNCDVLPDNSLIYSEFKVLNELNKIRIDGKLINKQVKHLIYNDLFRKEKNITVKTLEKFLKNNEVIDRSSSPIIKGFHEEDKFSNSLKAHIFFERLGFDVDEEDRELVENLIRWITLFSDKKILKKEIRNNCSKDMISDDVLKKVLKCNFSGWGRLSNELINEVGSTSRKYRESTILDILKHTNLNFIQIISDDELGFKDIIEERNTNIKDKITSKDIQELQGSPAIKRAIWQSVKITEEIVGIMKKPPRNIFIEVARSEENKKRKDTRFKKIEEIYEAVSKSGSFIVTENVKEAMDYIKKEKNEKIDNERLYLFLLQNGKCMYSGVDLDYKSLSQYEVDHIVPRTIIKDDSIDNKVLVTSRENQNKSDSLVLKSTVRHKMSCIWEKLLACGLMSQKKHWNLNRNEFTKNQVEGFINRQLVETRQITRHIANLFRNYYVDTDIVMVKGNIVSNLRNKHDLFKSRSLNDFHHSHDAYLTGLLGNFIKMRFPAFKDRFYYDMLSKYNFKDYRQKYGFIISEFEKPIFNHNSDLVWDPDSIIIKMKKYINYNDCYISYKKEENTGEFYNQNALKRGNGNLMPLKKGLDPKLYGGYGNVNKSYLMVVKVVKKGKENLCLIGCPIFLRNKSVDDKIEYLKIMNDCDDIEIIKDKILINQLVISEGMPLILKSDKELSNAVNLLLNKEYKRIVHLIERENYSSLQAHELEALYDIILKKIVQFYPVYKNIHKKLLGKRKVFLELSISEKSYIILELLKMLKANSGQGNLKKIGLQERSGRLNKKVKVEDLIFIETSVTGMYEERWSVVKNAEGKYKIVYEK
ncbi:MAG: type II CRISPR RNA-guided endonuclease Cas9 [Tissierellales bacterium]|jgi:CRISPR-associated endonuclease Csn1|nr:type II CRISPR RNA-guided endonuclease Cas9 [Tissierellales bacterium]